MSLNIYTVRKFTLYLIIILSIITISYGLIFISDTNSKLSTQYGNFNSDYNESQNSKSIADKMVVQNISGQNREISIRTDIRSEINTTGLTINLNIPHNSRSIELSIDGQQVYSTNNSSFEHRIKTDADSITYRFELSDPYNSNSFVSKNVVFLNRYDFDIIDRNYKFSSDNIVLGDSVNYRGLYIYEDNMVIYKEPTSITNRNLSTHNFTIVSEKSHNDSQDIYAATEVSNMFSEVDEVENTVLFILDPDGIRSGGYATGHLDNKQTVWVAHSSFYDRYHTLMHEVVHSYQDFESTSNLRWFREGNAQYIATLGVSNKVDWFNASEVEFNERWYESISLDSEENHTNLPKLSEPETWDGYVEYNRGEHVNYLIDLSLRYHTNGQIDIIDLVRWMNNEGTVTYYEFRSYIVNKTDEQFGNRLDNYTKETEPIDISDEKYNITQNKLDILS